MCYRLRALLLKAQIDDRRSKMALKKTEVAKFKKRLEDMRMQLTHSLKGSTAEVKTPDEATGYSQHQADQGTDDFDRTISLEVTSKEYGILRQIDRALEKIEENTYGICDITGEDIPIARLDAVPYAVMTVKAQEKFEKGLL
ncbi:General stress protein 16O [Candidatus Protochlamydia amoebophila]|nr:General stress protein 16O [Candidatus Protochlamydia amoebophila]